MKPRDIERLEIRRASAGPEVWLRGLRGVAQRPEGGLGVWLRGLR